MKKVLFTLILIGSVYVLQAQPLNPNNPVPLDGGISLLVAAGALYGAKKLKDSRSKI
jgi:hypothetical protein